LGKGGTLKYFSGNSYSEKGSRKRERLIVFSEAWGNEGCSCGERVKPWKKRANTHIEVRRGSKMDWVIFGKKWGSMEEEEGGSPKRF